MANKRLKEKNTRISQQKAKETRYNLICEEIRKFPLIGLAFTLISVLLFFVTWASVYNTDISENEVQINGFNCLIAAFTGKYSTTNPAIGDMSIPFYYYAKSHCEILGILTLIAFIASVLNIVVQTLTYITKKHALNVISIFLSLAAFILLIACFATALSMKNAKILSVYCSGNPACFIRSLAFFPALAALGTLLISVIAAVKYFTAKYLYT